MATTKMGFRLRNRSKRRRVRSTRRARAYRERKRGRQPTSGSSSALAGVPRRDRLEARCARAARTTANHHLRSVRGRVPGKDLCSSRKEGEDPLRGIGFKQDVTKPPSPKHGEPLMLATGSSASMNKLLLACLSDRR